MTFRTALDLRTVASIRISNNATITRSHENQWELLAPLVFEVGHLGSGDIIQVPVGFRTDLASVPRLWWPFIPPHGAHAAAAVLHDWLYSTKTRSRSDTDAVFHEAMLVSGTPRARARLMWLAVRAFGWIRWP